MHILNLQQYITKEFYSRQGVYDKIKELCYMYGENIEAKMEEYLNNNYCIIHNYIVRGYFETYIISDKIDKDEIAGAPEIPEGAYKIDNGDSVFVTFTANIKHYAVESIMYIMDILTLKEASRLFKVSEKMILESMKGNGGLINIRDYKEIENTYIIRKQAMEKVFGRSII